MNPCYLPTSITNCLPWTTPMHPLPSTIHRLQAIVYHGPTTICTHHLPPVVYHPPSTINRQLPTVYHPLSTIHHLPSTFNHLPSAVYHPPATLYHPPTIYYYHIIHNNFTRIILSRSYKKSCNLFAQHMTSGRGLSLNISMIPTPQHNL